jgi:hypothetical protein
MLATCKLLKLPAGKGSVWNQDFLREERNGNVWLQARSCPSVMYGQRHKHDCSEKFGAHKEQAHRSCSFNAIARCRAALHKDAAQGTIRTCLAGNAGKGRRMRYVDK